MEQRERINEMKAFNGNLKPYSKFQYPLFTIPTILRVEYTLNIPIHL